MTEYFRIEGLNNINFDLAATGPYRLTKNVPPRNTSSPLTRDQVLMELTRLPKGVRGQALNRGMSKVSFTFNIQADTDALMEAYLHDFTETLQDGQLYVETEGARGTQAVLRSKTDGAANDSYKTIWYGYIEEQAARNLLGDSIKAHYLKDLQVTLYMESKWRPESAITLGPNEIYCPSFEEDGDANGRADDWSTIGPPAALAMEATIVLHGCYSQKVSTNGAVQGLGSVVIVAPAVPANDAVAYIWVCRPAAGTNIRAAIRDTTAAVDRATADYSAATTTVTVGGYEWRRLELIATNNIVPGNNHQLLIYSLAADVTDWYIDKAFWKWDTTIIPDEWCDHWLIYNHYDTTEGAAHEGHQNYFDVDDLKGDVEARLLMRVEWQQKADLDYAKNLIVARRTRQPPCKLFWWAEAEDANASTNWAPGALARCSAGSRVTNNANVAGLIRIDVSPAGLIGSDEFDGKFDVFAAAYTDDIDNTMLRLYSGELLDLRHYNLWKKLNAASKWQLVHLGEIPWNQFIRTGAVHDQLQIFVEYQKDAADTVELDFLWFIPKDEPKMRLDISDLVVNVQSLQVGQWWVFDNSADFNYAAREYLVPPLRSNTVVWRIGNYGLMPRIENRSYFVCETFDTPDEVYECHGAATPLQMIVNIDYLPQYISPLE